LPPPPAGYTWVPVPQLSDEFNETTLDTTKWLPSAVTGWPGQPPFQFDPNNVSVTSGGLALANTVSGPPSATNWINAAFVSSLQPIATYGYYAASIKASDVSMTSSFWLQGTYSEIDVEENVGASTLYPISNRMVPNTHYFPNGWATDIATPFFYTMPTGAADGYATYSVWWKDENNIEFFYNGNSVATVTLPYNFDEPMYLYFNTGALSFFGFPTVASLSDPNLNKMNVQWVRSWKLSPQ
jgi:hypothetical protein